jgi:hypothetical protein
MLSLARELPFPFARWWRAFTRWLRICDPVDAIGAAVADGALGDGVIGAVCAQTGAAITKAAAMAVPLSTYFMAFDPRDWSLFLRRNKRDAGLPRPASPSPELQGTEAETLQPRINIGFYVAADKCGDALHLCRLAERRLVIAGRDIFRTLEQPKNGIRRMRHDKPRGPLLGDSSR